MHAATPPGNFNAPKMIIKCIEKALKFDSRTSCVMSMGVDPGGGGGITSPNILLLNVTLY